MGTSRGFRISALVAVMVGVTSTTALGQDIPPPGPADLDNGNILIQTIIPTIVPRLLDPAKGNKPGDATIVLRVTTLTMNAAFDAIAPYHPTAVGVASRLGRRPAAERTNRNKNIAILYATNKILHSLYPKDDALWRTMFAFAGQNPDDTSTDPTTAVGIGNLAGAAVVNSREHDGMNQLGDEGGREYNRFPYADTTGYEPVNSPFELRDPTRWQPDIQTNGNGIFNVQKYVTPQLEFVRPYFLQNPHAPRWRVPAPVDSQLRGPRAFQRYKAQLDYTLAQNAALNDTTRMLAETFENKIASLGWSALFIGLSRNMTIDQFVQYDFLTNAAAFDSGIICWRNKTAYDAVRPVSAAKFVYGDRRVTAYVPNVGTRSVRASEWRPYINTANHPEYPSGSACFCAAHAQASRRFLGSDALGDPLTWRAGSSVVEPGRTPAVDTTYVFPTWTDFEQKCQEARVNTGVHFQPAVVQGAALCKPVGDEAYEWLQRLVAGSEPPLAP